MAETGEPGHLGVKISQLLYPILTADHRGPEDREPLSATVTPVIDCTWINQPEVRPSALQPTHLPNGHPAPRREVVDALDLYLSTHSAGG